MKSLANALLGDTRSAVLAALLLRPEQALHVRELARVTGVSPGTLHRELKTLESLGILSRAQTGKQVFYVANRRCPVFDELAGLLRKTAGLVDVLRGALLPFSDRIEQAFVYGSMAVGDEHVHSDVDVMIVGILSFGEVVEALAPAQTALRREVNPTLFTPQEFVAKRLDAESFAAKVWQGPKLWLIGDGNESG